MFRRSLLSLLLTAVALPSLGQAADMYVDITNDDRQPTLRTTYVVQARWNEPVSAENVVVEFDVPGAEIVTIHKYDAKTNCVETERPVRCTLSGEQDDFGGFAVAVRFPRAGSYTATARISSTTPDPNPANNTDTHTISVAGLPSLRPYGRADLFEGSSIDPAGPGRFRVGVQNTGEPATNVVLRVTMPEGGHFAGLDPREHAICTQPSATEIVCRFTEEWSYQHRQISFPFVAPDRPDGGTFPFIVSADADEDDYDPENDSVRINVLLRDLIAVTHGGDEGPGSLRQAILEARTACEDIPCLIGVRASGPIVIQPRTALSEVRGRVKIDGASITTLDGSLLPAGDALRFEDGCELRVDRLVIRNFQGHAIEVHQKTQPTPQEPYPCGFDSPLTPVFVTRSELLGNLRGVVTKGVSATITDNRIRDHRRAGIFVDRAYYTSILRNEVTGNGASGIFIHPGGGGFWLPAGADVFDNKVHDNGEWGIARAATGAVNIRNNVVSGNNLYGIDYGLDLSTPDAPNKPAIHSATYDAARNATIIRGTMTPVTSYGAFVDLYASASLSRWGYPEAERWLVTVGSGNFEAVVPGDLRGQWITATGTRIVDVIFLRDEGAVGTNGIERTQANDTSELSDAVRVQ